MIEFILCHMNCAEKLLHDHPSLKIYDKSIFPPSTPKETANEQNIKVKCLSTPFYLFIYLFIVEKKIKKSQMFKTRIT